MAVLRDRPYGNFNYLVDLGTGNSDGAEAGFSEVQLPEAWIDVIEYRDGNDRENGVRKIPGRSHYGNIVLKRGAMGSLDLYSWWNDVRNGNITFRTVTIHLQNEDRTSVVMTWKLHRAWPVRYGFSELNATGHETLIESLELAFERLEME